MMAPRLNRQLVLETRTRLPDGAGGYHDRWVALGTLWAKISAGNGRSAAGTAGPLSRTSYQIVVRAAPQAAASRPTPHHRFREGSRLFRILSVTEDDQDARFLRCTAQEDTTP